LQNKHKSPFLNNILFNELFLSLYKEIYRLLVLYTCQLVKNFVHFYLFLCRPTIFSYLLLKDAGVERNPINYMYLWLCLRYWLWFSLVRHTVINRKVCKCIIRNTFSTITNFRRTFGRPVLRTFGRPVLRTFGRPVLRTFGRPVLRTLFQRNFNFNQIKF
jgi:hypothetical protein